ncbi:MAG TPA: hypothetical protein VKI62_06475 [Bacteroidota bacterium]|nr:hypothetical protein [Bacteroidota bacterium]
MAKVLFTISYEVHPEKRDEYLVLTRQMKDLFSKLNGKSYSIFEQKGKKNNFSEVFLFDSMEEYDRLEDHDEQMGALVEQLESLLVGKKMKYTTLIELV